MARSETFESYKKHLDRYGPEGVLGAAKGDLSEEEYNALVKLVGEAPKRPKRPVRRKKTRR